MIAKAEAESGGAVSAAPVKAEKPKTKGRGKKAANG
jgi:hypothetical protein